MASLFEKLTEPKVVKNSVILAMLIFLPSLVIAIIIAYSFGGTKIGPYEFSPFSNWISDLGSVRYTPAPFILDSIAIICSFLMIPVFLYFKVHFDEAPLRKEGVEPKYLKACEWLGLIFLLIGDIGLFGIGLFSEDRSFPPYSLHEVFSVVVWGGMAIAALFIGIVSLHKDTIFTRIVAVFMIFGPPIVTPTYVLLYLAGNPLNYIFEWLMLFCIFIWLIPFSLKLVRILDSELQKS